MGNKTSQLQIRVTPEQKAALKRLAASAGVPVSQYVLTTVLPSATVEFARRVGMIRGSGSLSKALSDFVLYLSDLTREEFSAAAEGPDLEDLSPVLRNAVAAAVEQVAARKGLPTPSWTSNVAPLPEPHFSWRLSSLKPHLMRVTPLAFKRRNVFVAARQDQRR